MRKIHTTFYVNKAILELINHHAEHRKIKSNELIVLLLRNFLKRKQKIIRIYSTVKYQKGADFQLWKIHHVSLNAVDYEIFTDMRKLFKMSVSLMLKLAVDDFLLQSECRDLDNYCTVSYEITKKIEQNNIIWSIYWHKDLYQTKKE